MTPMEILHKIVEAEGSAQAVFNEATALKEGFDDYVNVQIEALKKQYFSRAEKAILEAGEHETARANAEIAQLDKKLEAELAVLKTQFEQEREAIVLKVFKLAVNVDD